MMSYQQLLNKVVSNPENLINLASEISLLNSDEIHQLYLDAVSSKAEVLKKIPEDKRTPAICLAAIEKFGFEIFKDVPIKVRTLNLCLAAIKKNSSIFNIIKNYQENTRLTDSEFRQVVYAAINQDPFLLQEIPIELCNVELYLHAVNVSLNSKYDASILDYLKNTLGKSSQIYQAILVETMLIQEDWRNKIKEYINDCENAQDIWPSIIKRGAHILEYVPEHILNENICLAAIKKNVDAFQFIPEDLRAKLFDMDGYLDLIKRSPDVIKYIPQEILYKIITTEEQAINILKKNGLLLKYIPESLQNPTLYKIAVNQNGLALQDVPKPEQTYTLCMDAIIQDRSNQSVMQYIMQVKNELSLTADEYKELLILTIQYCPAAINLLEDESDKFKKDVISSITPEKILYEDYSALEYFPADNSFDSEVKQFLVNIKHVVIVQSYTPEIRDVYLIYANHPKRKGHIICTREEDAQELFDKIKLAQDNNNSSTINLVLLGHSRVESKTIAGMNVKEIADFINKNESINRLTLLGCNTAKAAKLEKEKTMIRHFANKQKNIKKPICGFFFVKEVNTQHYFKYLKNADQVYILTKKAVGEKNEYGITFLQKNTEQNNSVTRKDYPLSEEEFELLQNSMLTPKGKKYTFPTDDNILNIRDELSNAELNKINQVINKYGIFDKANPDYKQNKTEYVPLHSVRITEDEIHKISQYNTLLVTIDSDQSIHLVDTSWSKKHELPMLIKRDNQVYMYGFSGDSWKITQLNLKTFEELPFPEKNKMFEIDGSFLTDAMRAEITAKDAHTQSLLERVYKNLVVNRAVDIKGFTGIMSAYEKRLLKTSQSIYADPSYPKTTFHTSKDNINREKLDADTAESIEKMATGKEGGMSEAKSFIVPARKQNV